MLIVLTVMVYVFGVPIHGSLALLPAVIGLTVCTVMVLAISIARFRKHLS